MASAADSPGVLSVREALRRVVDPCSIATGVPVSLEEMGLIQRVETNADGSVLVELRLTSPLCFQPANMVEKITEVARELGVADVRVQIDYAAQWLPHMMAEGAQRRLRRVRPFVD